VFDCRKVVRVAGGRCPPVSGHSVTSKSSPENNPTALRRLHGVALAGISLIFGLVGAERAVDHRWTLLSWVLVLAIAMALVCVGTFWVGTGARAAADCIFGDRFRIEVVARPS
jgi:hypothetical protein